MLTFGVEFMKAPVFYTIFQKACSVVMILALLWLTVSLPYVTDARALIAEQTSTAIPAVEQPVENTEEANSLANSVEEKVPSNSSVLEEYLHHHNEELTPDNPRLSHIDKHSSDLYAAFHGELLSPPPESFLA